MSSLEPLWVCLVGAGAGLLIGAVGVGGIIIVPLLLLLPQSNVQEAVASALFSYIFAGLAGAVAYIRHSSVVWRVALWYIGAATPAAFIGAFVLEYLSDFAVKLSLDVVIIASAIFSLYRHFTQRDSVELQEPDTDSDATLPSSGLNADQETQAKGPVIYIDLVDMDESQTLRFRVQAIIIGVITGFGSALTGSSGPVLLLPLILTVRPTAGVLETLGTAQVIQVPIALASTLALVLLRPGTIDFAVGGYLAAGLVPCVLLGAIVAHRVPAQKLKLVVSILLVIAGVVLLTLLLLDRFGS